MYLNLQNQLNLHNPIHFTSKINTTAKHLNVYFFKTILIVYFCLEKFSFSKREVQF